MAKIKDEDLPVLGENTTPGMLVDELGPIRKEKNRLDALDKFYSAAIKARIEPGELTIDGDKWVCMRSITEANRFSQEEAKKYLTEEQFQSCFKPAPMETLRFTKKPEKKPDAIKEPTK